MVVVYKVVERDESGFGASRRRRHQQKPLPCARKRGGLFGPKASFLSSSQSSIILWDPNPFPPSLSRQMSHHHHQQQVRRLERFFFPLSFSLSLRFLPLRAVRRLFCRVRAFGTGSFLRRWRDGGGEVFDAEVSNHHHHHHHHHHLLLSSFTTSRPMIAHQ